MKIVRYISICLLFTFIGSLLPTKAQDNPYKIDHSLYLLYEEATKHRNNATGLEIADTIYTKPSGSTIKRHNASLLPFR